MRKRSRFKYQNNRAWSEKQRLYQSSCGDPNMLWYGAARGFTPECVVFDSWYSSLANLKQIRDWGWVWLTRLKANRLVNPDRTGLRPVARVDTAAFGAALLLHGNQLV